MLASVLDTIIREHVNNILNKRDITYIEPPDYAASDSFGEVLEKLAILHIRTWHLEDAMQSAKTDPEAQGRYLFQGQEAKASCCIKCNH